MPLTTKMLGERLREARTQAQLKQEDVARAVGVERTILGKIEAGTRNISGLELDRLARFYRRDIRDFLSEHALREDPLVVLGRTVAPELLNCEDVTSAVELIRKASEIERLLGEPVWATPPGYDFSEPSSPREADEQGREMASMERQRLGLGNGPIPDVAELITCQGIWAAAFPFPAEISGLFICSPGYGMAILVNCDNAKGRRRFSYAHEYAHALADRDRSPSPSSTANAKDYVERRADVFASEFLVPVAGVHECLERFRKGLKSRVNVAYWDAAQNRGEQVEERVATGSQRITALEAWFISNEFRVSYEMAVYRLRHAGAIRQSEVEQLKAQKHLGDFMMREFKFFDAERETAASNQQPHLKMHLARLLVEAYRRGVIYTSKFREMCELGNLQFDEVYPLAKLAKEALVAE